MIARAVLVKTCQKYRDRRLACEATWAGALRRAGVPVWFAEGGHRNTVVVGGRIQTATGDEYRDNCRKLRASLSALSFIIVHESIYVFVCDDDTFIHPQRWLAHEPAGDLEGRVYRPTDLQRSQHGIDWWVHGGPGWWMSAALCRLYVEHAIERTSSDDVVVSKIALAAGIIPNDRPDLYGGDHYFGQSEVVGADNNIVSCHPVGPERMAALYAATARLGGD